MPSSLTPFTIAPESSVEEAIQKIEENASGTLIVVADGRVVGTVTDGDIRKAYLRHRLSVIPVREVMNTDFLSVLPGETAEAKALFASRFYLRLLPVVDRSGVLVSVIRRDEVS